jgi:hypothetical protein
MPESPSQTSVLKDRLRLGTGFSASERPDIIDRLDALERRLGSFSPDGVDLEVSIKERDGADQRVTLECWMAGQARLVSTSARPALQDALTEVRDDMVRQINDATTRQEPRNNRHLREQP